MRLFENIIGICFKRNNDGFFFLGLINLSKLLDLFGLKVGDKLRIEDIDFIVKKFINDDELYLDNKGYCSSLMRLIDEDYEIIKQTPTLTEDEKVILRNLHEEYKWICRLYDDTLYITDAKPQSSQSQWGFANCQYAKSIPFENIFKFITWEDEEPYNIKELLNEN